MGRLLTSVYLDLQVDMAVLDVPEFRVGEGVHGWFDGYTLQDRAIGQ